MSARESGRGQERALCVSHVADFGRRYPGEAVTFYTRVEAGEALSDWTLRITLPPGLLVEDYACVHRPGAMPLVTYDEGTHHLVWRVHTEPGTLPRCEYRVRARVAAADPLQPRPATEAGFLESQALVTASVEGDDLRDVESATVVVERQARSLKYLPAIYQDDELLGRFLMLFESFWAPIEEQIGVSSLYFDPRFTPTDFLPWLASWIDLVLDERWPEERRRRLLRSAVSLYRTRGTRQGLEEYLEIYTGQRPRIVEHRAHNFRLGPEARLGPGVALGTVNMPHTFTVTLRLPPLAGSGREVERHEQERRQRIQAIVEAEKPAHTNYVLRIELESETNRITKGDQDHG